MTNTFNHGDAIILITFGLAALFVCWPKSAVEPPMRTNWPRHAKGHQTCKEARCPCGFKLRLSSAETECQKSTCDWRDRDVCCVGDFDAGDYPPCYGMDTPQYQGDAIVMSTPVVEGWPTFQNQDDVQVPVTSPMMHEMTMDAYRGCAEANQCEQTHSLGACEKCVRKQCKGLNASTSRPKAVPWYPSALAGTPERLVYAMSCPDCFLVDANGRGDGRKGCSGVYDWLHNCTADTPEWVSSEGKTCSKYTGDIEMLNYIPSLFPNVSLLNDVKENCCETWRCALSGECLTKTTTTTTTTSAVDISKCTHDEGCHQDRGCPCHMFVTQLMNYSAWNNETEERKVRASCCDTVQIYMRVKSRQSVKPTVV